MNSARSKKCLWLTLILCIGFSSLPYGVGMADQLDSQFTAKILPCAGSCKAMQWGLLEIRRVGVEGSTFNVPTSMHWVDSVHTTHSGNLIVTGRLENELAVIEIVEPDRKASLAEFWTTSFGISTDGRLIAFTQFFSPHGPESIYDGAMVYVVDADERDRAAEGFTTLPSSAVPVFPPMLVAAGRKYVMGEPRSKLFLVSSSDFKWLSPTSFVFAAEKLTLPGVVTPITMTATGLDWKHAVGTSGQSLSCASGDVSGRDVDSLLRSCTTR